MNKSFTREMVENWVSDAVTDWSTDNAYGIPNTFTSGSGTGNITYHAGKAEAMSNYYNMSFIGANGNVVNGRTKHTKTSAGTVTVDNVSKSVKKVTSATVYVMNKLSSGDYSYENEDTGENYIDVHYNSRTTTGHANTVKHELGHALGYHGHSTDSNDLMTGNGTSNSTLLSVTARDRRHIAQFLNFNSNNANSIGYKYPQIESLAPYWRVSNNVVIAQSNLEFVVDSISFTDALLVGTPIEIIQGSLDTLDCDEDEDCTYLLTEYLFMLSDKNFSENEKYVIVRSQVGNIFELGKEYTFSAMRINNTLYDNYTVNSRRWVLDNNYTSE